MSCHKCIGIAFAGLGETGKAAVLPQRRKFRLASGQQLMHIRLMTYIKNQAVFHCIKYRFNGNRQFHNTQVSGKMAAGA